jgi:hypothetical protein
MARKDEKPPESALPASAGELGNLIAQVEALLEKNESIRRQSAQILEQTKELLQRIEAHRQ